MNDLNLSVIMPCLNPGKFLDESINSCLAQKDLHELIIADGGSDQKTIDKLNVWSNKDKRVKYYSKKDKNVSDALNFALSKASGSIIGWLNTDDLYSVGSIRRAIEYFKVNSEKVMVYGNGIHINEKGEFIEKYPSRFDKVNYLSFQDGCFICQPTAFIKKKVLEEIGGFNLEREYAFDLDLWMRIFKKYSFKKIGFINNLQAYSRLHKSSITANYQWLINIECALIMEKYIGKPKDHWLRTASIFYFKKFGNYSTLDNSILFKKIKLTDYVEKGFRNELKSISRESFIEKEYKQLIGTIPKEFILILFSRIDLINKFIYKKIDYKNYANWIINYGIHEYKFLLDSNETNKTKLIEWISRNITYEKKNLKLLIILNVIKIKFIFNNFRKIIDIYINSLYKYIFFNIFIKRNYVSRIIKINKLYKKVNIVIDDNHHKINPFEICELIKLIDNKISVTVSRGGYFCDAQLKNSKPIKNHKYDLTIFLMNISELVDYLFKNNISHKFAGHKIAYIDWDLELVPKYYDYFVDYFDEIWTTNNISYKAIKNISKSKNVLNFPPFFTKNDFSDLSFHSREIKISNNNDFMIKDDSYIFYTEIDLMESFDKNNLMGSLSAFFRAFPDESNLEIKSKIYFFVYVENKDSNPLKFDYLKNCFDLDPRIKIIEKDFSTLNYHKRFNCYVSLHRACGYNNAIKKAFDSNISIIHTGFGGHLDYCSHDNSYPVGFKYSQISPKSYKYWPSQRWAEPNIKNASEIMKKVFLEYKKKRKISNFSNNYNDNKFRKNISKRLKYLLN